MYESLDQSKYGVRIRVLFFFLKLVKDGKFDLTSKKMVVEASDYKQKTIRFGLVLFFNIILQIFVVFPLFSFAKISCGYIDKMSGQWRDSGK